MQEGRMPRGGHHNKGRIIGFRSIVLSILLLSTVILTEHMEAQTISVLYTFQDTPDGAQVYGRLLETGPAPSTESLLTGVLMTKEPFSKLTARARKPFCTASMVRMEVPST